MKIAKDRVIGLLKIIRHLEEENETLRNACMSGYKMFDALKTKYENKLNQHSAHIAKLWRYYKNEKKDI